jgi:glutathionylspermidine synthase
MQRIPIEPRPGWQKKVEQLGLVYHSLETPYWDESAYYAFTAQEIDTLEAATNELHRLCLEAVQSVIDRNLFARLHIPEPFVPLILNSWEKEQLSLYGRFDLWFDGVNPPKMYEYNADTPTSLLEAAVVQWHWLEERFPGADQFNSIHEKLLARWQESGMEGTVHFACDGGHEEDFANTVYMEDTALQAGMQTKRLFMNQIGWDSTRKRFVDLQNEPIRVLFKLYPWEWMIREQFGIHLVGEPWQLVEPAWKMVLSNKAILPILWELFPGHPHLLPAFDSPQPLGNSWVKKPIFGREGANVTLNVNGREVTTDGDYTQEGFIYQALQLPPCFEGHYPVIGSWIAQDEAAGIGIRESDTPITRNTSRFIPHLFG